MEFSDKDIRRAKQIVQVLESKAFNDKAIASSKFGRHSILTGDTQFRARERGFVLVRGDVNTTRSVDENRLIAELYRINKRKSAISSSFIGPPEPLTKGTLSGVGTNLPAVYDPRLAVFQTARQARFRREAEARNRDVDPMFKYRINSSVGLFHSKSKSAMESASVFQSSGVSDLERAYESSIRDIHTVPTEEEMLTKDEKYERLRLAKLELARSRRSGLRKYAYDMMPDERRELYDLTLKYGDRNLARRAMNENALRQFPWLKTLAKSNPIIAKNLPDIANVLKKGAKTPIIGHLIKHPYIAAAGIGLGILHKIASHSTNIAKSIPLETMSGISLSNLITAGHEISAWGGSKEDIAKSAIGFSGKQGLMMAGLGGTSHLKTLAALGIDIRGTGRYGMLSNKEMLQRVSRAIKEANDIGDIDRVVALANTQGFTGAMVEAAKSGYDFSDIHPISEIQSSGVFRNLGEILRKLWDSPTIELTSPIIKGINNSTTTGAQDTLGLMSLFMKDKEVNKAIQSAEEYSRNKTSSVSGDGRNVSYVWNLNGDVNLPEVKDGMDFARAIPTLSSDLLKEYAQPVIDANESLAIS